MKYNAVINRYYEKHVIIRRMSKLYFVSLLFYYVILFSVILFYFCNFISFILCYFVINSKHIPFLSYTISFAVRYFLLQAVRP